MEVQFQPDADLYYRIFGELFLYLRQYKPTHPWRVVILYPSRNTEVEQPHQFQELLSCSRVQRIYLDELDAAAEPSLGVKVVKLVIEPEETAAEQARQLIAIAQKQLSDAAVRRDLINLIETIIVYKLPKKSREEIATMLNLSELKQTRFYQEVKQEGIEEGWEEGREEGERQAKLDAIPRLLQIGLNAEQIARGLNFSLELIEEAVTRLDRQEMSFSEQNIDTFVELLTQQRSLFSAEQLTELTREIERLPDDVDILSEAISAWVKKYPQLEQAQAQLLEPLNRLSSDRVPESQQDNSSRFLDRCNKKAIEKAIENG